MLLLFRLTLNAGVPLRQLCPRVAVTASRILSYHVKVLDVLHAPVTLEENNLSEVIGTWLNWDLLVLTRI